MSPRPLRGQGLSALFMALTLLCPARTSRAASPAQEPPVAPRRYGLGTVGVNALRYFAATRQRSWSGYLKGIRPAAVSAELRARSLAMVRKEDVIEPSADRQAKLNALRPVLEYL